MLARWGSLGALLVGCTSVKAEMLYQRVQGSRNYSFQADTHSTVGSLQPLLPQASSLEPQLQMRVNPRSLKSQRHTCGSLLPLFHSPDSGPPFPAVRRTISPTMQVPCLYSTLIYTCPVDLQRNPRVASALQLLSTSHLTVTS